MPRIVPIQLLKCLKVLLNANGGILSTGEVKRIATLMSKYSKKLVSKCIYVQILKCTDTELLDEFMAVGGWNLVYTWLTDGIRLMNWPLVKEILELLLLCPVDVLRLKINSAPKMVKGLCGGSDEGVCILARRLVEQWLKIVTDGNEAQQQNQQRIPGIQQPFQFGTQSVQPNMTSTALVTPKFDPYSSAEKPITLSKIKTKFEPSSDVEDNEDEKVEEGDPLAMPDEMVVPKSLTPTIAQKKASKAGLVYKIVVRNGQQLLTKVESKPDEDIDDATDGVTEKLKENDAIIEEDADGADELEEDSTSLDKLEDKDSSESSAEDKKIDEKKSLDIKDKEKMLSKEQREHRRGKDGKSKEHKSEKDKEKDKERKSSSSSHRSSSHKSSSKSSSSSSKSKSSSSVSSPSSHRSSSDKYRSDKDRLSSNSSSSKDKDKERSSSSSSSSKHKSSSSSSKSSSSSSSSKERHREKDKDKSTSSSSSSSSSLSSSLSKKDKEREKELQAEKDKDTLAKMLPPSLDKLGKIPKKSKDEKSEKTSDNASNSSIKPTSITIPSKKASMSIEIRRDTDKMNTVKTYKSQFRSHGLTEEAPPPPSRKTLKKPSSSSASQTGTVIPTSLPSSLKRPSPPPRDSPTEKKAKIDINQITPAGANVEKPGAIKLIPAKRIQTLVETNIFSDALSAATGPKKVVKRKRPANSHKDEPSTPTSPDAPKVAPLKFYQDTLDESAKAANEDKSDKSKDDETNNNDADTEKENNANITDEDDDIPLKKVKEDIEQQVRKEKAAAIAGDTIDITSDVDDEGKANENVTPAVEEVRKPGPGCGPDGPPGVLMLHRRKGPKKKLSWRPQEQLEQIRYFESDENERVNVMKVSFHDMKNMERFNERTSLNNMTKRGPRPGDNQEPRTEWRPLMEVDDVPVHPDGAQSKERKVQADREMTTLRALYFSSNMIPDSPSEAEIEPHYPGDPPTIPLDDITGNQDTINDFSGMPWPEPKGSPKHGDNAMSGTGGLGGLGNPAADMFPGVLPNNPTNMKNPFSNNKNNFMGPFGGNAGPGPNNMPSGPGPQQMPPMPPNGWQGPPKNSQVPIISNAFSLNPNADMMPGGPNFIPPLGQFNGPPPFMQGRNTPFGPPPPGFNGPNFNQMGPGNPMVGPMGNNMGPVPLMNVMNNGPRGGNNNRNNNNWINGPNNFQDNNMNNGNWRPAGSGPNRTGNNGVCKAYMRGNCRVSKCKFIHPKKRL